MAEPTCSDCQEMLPSQFCDGVMLLVYCGLGSPALNAGLAPLGHDASHVHTRGFVLMQAIAVMWRRMPHGFGSLEQC